MSTSRSENIDKPRVSVMGLRGFPFVQGGVEKHCEALYPHMTSDFFFSVYRRRPYIPPQAPQQWPGIRFIDLPSTRIKGFEAFFHSLLACCRIIADRPDIVHIHNIGPGLFSPLLKLFGLKVVTTYHSANYEHKKWGAFARAVLRMGERFTLSASDRIIFVNKAKYMSHPERVRRKSRLIVNGVTAPEPVASTDYIASLGLAPHSYLLGVGRLTPEKGFEHLIEAVNSLPFDVPVVIAGGADHQPEYLDRLRALDKRGLVTFAGNLQGEPLRELYSHARAFVLSSVTEGFPLVLLEAMSYGLPVLVSRIEATRDIPGLPEENFFEAAAPQELASLLESRWKTLADSRPRYDMSPYNWETIAAQTACVYRSILER